MGKQWTDDQKKAITSGGNNLLIAAAAGSGKTAVLVERVIQKIMDSENPVDIDRFLIVTFTDASAGQMKERIYQAITKAMDKCPDNEHLRRQLTLLPRASISTFHSFCQGIIRNNFHILGLSSNFSLGDDATVIPLRNQALEQVLMEGDYDNLELFEGVEGKSKNTVTSVVLRIFNFLQSLPYPEKWLDELKEFYRNENFMKYYGNLLIQKFRMELKHIVETYDEAVEIAESPGGPENIVDFLTVEQERLEQLQYVDNWDDLYSILSTFTFEKKPRKKAEYDPELVDVVAKIRKYSNTFIKKYGDIFYDNTEGIFEDNDKCYLTIHSLARLCVDFMHRFSQLKREQNLLDFGDLEQYAIKLLTEFPDVLEELRGKYAEVYIDEYQDTNGVQSTIIEAVTRGDNLFMVGDVKQCIYKFRNAEPSLFLDKLDSFEQNKALGETVFLSKNFRSAQGIINFINSLFSVIFSREIMGMEYSENEQLHFGENILTAENTAPVEIALIGKKLDLNDDELTDDAEYSDEVEREAHYIAGKISEVIGTEFFDKEIGGFREINYSDIVILLRTAKGVLSRVADVLSSYMIPVYTEEKGGFLYSLEIVLMLSFLQVIDNPYQDIPLMTLMRSPLYDISNETIGELRENSRDKDIYSCIQNSENSQIIAFATQVKEFRKYSNNAGLEELLRHIITATNLDKVMSLLPDGETKVANLHFICTLAGNFEETAVKTVYEFLNYINSYIENTTDFVSQKMISENDNVVKITTIHKSKGLEYPVVFIAGCNKKFNKRDISEPILYHNKLGVGIDFYNSDKMLRYATAVKNAIAYQKETELIAEEIRVLYVALTRAVSYLYIVGTVKEGYNPSQTATPYDVFSSQSLLDLVLMAVNNNGCSGAKITKLTANQIMSKPRQLDLWETATGKNAVDNNVCESKENSVYNEVNEILSYKYAYKNAENIPTKMSVSELVNKDLEKGMEENLEEGFEENLEGNNEKIVNKKIIFSQPKFYTNKENTAFLGTLAHFFMQNIDVQKTNSLEEIKKQLEKMINCGIIDIEYEKLIDINRFYKFFSTPIGERLKRAKKIYREVNFFTKIPANKVMQLDEVCDEEILVQGTVDCYFQEDDGYVVVDFKTGDPNKESYKKQIAIYCEALSKMLDKPIKESHICGI